MALQLSSYLLMLLGAVISSLLTAAVGFYYRDYTGARSLAVLMLAISWWSLTYMMALATTDPALKLLAYKFMYPAIAIVPVAWVFFAIKYTGRLRRPTRAELGGL
ncbi:MAG: histidine kinase N-terminal 7TM domain-containing protein, partial [Halobacteriaceae archaeon]